MRVWKILTETRISYSMPLFWHFVTLTVTCGLCIGLAISLSSQLWLIKLFLTVIAGFLLVDLEHFFKAQQQNDTAVDSRVGEVLEVECCKCWKTIAIARTESVIDYGAYCSDCWKAEREEAKQDRKRILKEKRQEISFLQAALTRKNQEIARLQKGRNEN